MQRANRHVHSLEFFQGYRNASGAEKVVDVAIGIDLITGIVDGDFDRVDIVGGDGDILYAIKVAHERMRHGLRVHLAPGQRLNQLGVARIAFTKWTAADLVEIDAADQGARSPVPARVSAAEGSLWVAQILTGPFGKLSASPAP